MGSSIDRFLQGTPTQESEAERQRRLEAERVRRAQLVPPPPSPTQVPLPDSTPAGLLRASLDEAAKMSASEGFRILRAQERTGYPESVVRDHLDEIEQELQSPLVTPEAIAERHPRLAARLARDRARAAALRADLPMLDRAGVSMQNIAIGKRRGWLNEQMHPASWRILRGIGTPADEAAVEAIQRELAQLPEEDPRAIWGTGALSATAEQVDQIINSTLDAGVGPAAMWLGGLAAQQAGKRMVAGGAVASATGVGAAAGVPAAGLGGALIVGGTAARKLAGPVMVGQMGIEAGKREAAGAFLEYRGLRDATGARILDDDEARGAALLVGVINGGAEVLGEIAIAKAFPGLRGILSPNALTRFLAEPTRSAAFRGFLKNIGGAMAGEGATEGFQEFVTIAMGRIAETAGSDALRGASLGERMGYVFGDLDYARIGQAAVLGATVGGTIATVGATASLGLDLRQSAQATRFAKQVDAVVAGVQQTAVAKEPLSILAQTLGELTANEQEDVWVDAKQFENMAASLTGEGETKVEPADIIRALGGDPTGFESARTAGTSFSLKLADVVALATKNDTARQFFFEHLQQDPNTPSRFQQAEASAEQARLLEEEHTKALASPQNTPTVDAFVSEVQAVYADRLGKTKKMTKAQVKRNAQLTAMLARVLVVSNGFSIEEVRRALIERTGVSAGEASRIPTELFDATPDTAEDDAAVAAAEAALDPQTPSAAPEAAPTAAPAPAEPPAPAEAPAPEAPVSGQEGGQEAVTTPEATPDRGEQLLALGEALQAVAERNRDAGMEVAEPEPVEATELEPLPDDEVEVPAIEAVPPTEPPLDALSPAERRSALKRARVNLKNFLTSFDLPVEGTPEAEGAALVQPAGRDPGMKARVEARIAEVEQELKDEAATQEGEEAEGEEGAVEQTSLSNFEYTFFGKLGTKQIVGVWGGAKDGIIGLLLKGRTGPKTPVEVRFTGEPGAYQFFDLKTGEPLAFTPPTEKAAKRKTTVSKKRKPKSLEQAPWERDMSEAERELEAQLQRQRELIARTRAYLERKGKLTDSDRAILDAREQAMDLPEQLLVDGVMRPTRNADGDLIVLTPAAHRNFWRWFGDSSLVDAQGRPVPVYHGTDSMVEYDKFIVRDWVSLGVHVGTVEQARAIVEPSLGLLERNQRGADTVRPRIIPLYARITNPLRLEDEGGWGFHTLQQLLTLGHITSEQYEGLRAGYRDRNSNGPWLQGEMVRIITEKGYDGVVYLNAYEGDDEVGSQDSYIVFSSKQLKAQYGNNGNFRRDRLSIFEQPVSTRFPTAQKARENPLAELLSIGLAEAKLDPRSFNKNAALIRTYVNLREVEGESEEQTVERFIDHVVENLLWLHDSMSPDLRDRARLWYDGARRIVDSWAPHYGLTDAQVSGIIAVLSPQKDWFMNVSLAKRVMDVMTYQQDTVWSPEMTARADFVKPNDGKRIVPDAELVKRIAGKRLRDLETVEERAVFVRVYDEVYQSSEYPIVTPEGDFGALVLNDDGIKVGAIAWGSYVFIEKAVAIFENGDIDNISRLLGEAHKVRNFYNNIFDPGSARGEVTIDTHAVAAALLRALSGSSREVEHNLAGGVGVANSSIFGIGGTYAFFAEAYRRAARERGLLPREMQSITWEAVRGLFSAGFKRSKNVEAIDAVWAQYRAGAIEADRARTLVSELAGGIEVPSWAGPTAGPDARAAATPDASGVPAAGRDAGTAGSGGGGVTPAAASAERARGRRVPPAVDAAAERATTRKGKPSTKAEFEELRQSPVTQLPPRWYSQLERAVAAAKIAVQPGTQWASWLKGNAAKLGIKQAEIEWSGVMNWLALKGSERVTRVEFLDYLKTNGLRVTTIEITSVDVSTIRVESETDALRAEHSALQRDRSQMTEQEDIDRANAQMRELERRIRLGEAMMRDVERRPTVPFSNYEMEGQRTGSRVMALVLDPQPAFPFSMPLPIVSHSFNSKRADRNRLLWLRLNVRIDTQGRRVLVVEELQSDWAQKGRKLGFRTAVPEEAAIEARILELVEERDRLSDEKEEAWDEAAESVRSKMPAIAAYAREVTGSISPTDHGLVEIAIDTMDKMISYLRENASRSFESRVDRQRNAIETLDRAETMRATPWFLRVQRDTIEQLLGGPDSPAAERYASTIRAAVIRYHLAYEDYRVVRDELGAANAQLSDLLMRVDPEGDSLLRAPFVENSSEWVALALKQMIRYASEEGYDAIAWTTGEQQAERWSSLLQHRVKRLQWAREPMSEKVKEPSVRLWAFDRPAKSLVPTPDGGWQLQTGLDGDYTPILEEVVPIRLLDGMLGEEMAERITKSDAESGTITGDEIRISSSGMVEFYDHIMPSVARDILKKVKGGRVSEIGLWMNDEVTEKVATLPAGIGDRAGWHDARQVWRDRRDAAADARDNALFDGDYALAGKHRLEYRAYSRLIRLADDIFTVFGRVPDGTTDLPEQLRNTVAVKISRVLGTPTAMPLLRNYSIPVQGPAVGEAELVKDMDNDSDIVPLMRQLFDELTGIELEWKDVEPSKQPAILLDPQLRANALDGMPLFQKRAKTEGPRGRMIRDRGSNRVQIELLENADESTYVHELAHLFLALRTDKVRSGTASPSLVADQQRLQRWFAGNAESLRREAKVMLGTSYTVREVSGEDGVVRYEYTTPRGQTYTYDTRADAEQESSMRRLATAKDLDAMEDGAVRALTSKRADESFADADALVKVAMEEQFARGFEMYLREGRAPTPELRSMFAAFRAWLIRVYYQLTSLNVTLTDEVREVMDRMVATEEEIAKAKTAQNDRPLFAHQSVEDLIAIGFTEKQATTYIALLNEAKETAHQQMAQQLMQDVERRNKGWWQRERRRITTLAREAARALPVYRAMSLLQTGALPDGTTPDGLASPFKLATTEDLPGMTDPNGLSPDLAAGVLGYPNGTALITALREAVPFDEYVAATAQQKMDELYPPQTDPQTLVDLAVRMIHTEARAAVLRFELEVLASGNLSGMTGMMAALGRRLPPKEQAVTLAKQIVGRQPIGKLRPDLYVRGEATAAKLAMEAARRGDWNEAFQQKQREVLNHALFVETTRMKEQRVRDRTFFRRLFRPDAKLAKTYDMTLVNTARAVLARVGLGKTDKDPLGYLEGMKKYDRPAYDAALTMLMTTVPAQSDLTKLTVAEYEEVMLQAKALWAQARRNQQVNVQGQKVEVADVVAELIANVEAKGPTTHGQLGVSRAPTEGEKNQLRLMGLAAALRRVESWVDAMDGGDPAGPWRRYVWAPISDAAQRFRLARNRNIEAYRKLLATLQAKTGRITGTPIEAPEIGYTFRDRAELLGALLHIGNTGVGSNYEKLIGGRLQLQRDTGKPELWTDANFRAMRDRMERDGLLQREDYEFLQGVWDLFEATKADAQRAHFELLGYYFNEVTATPVVTRFGTFAGGYTPAIADSMVSNRAAVREAETAMDMNADATIFPSVQRGFTKDRTQVADPLVMDLHLVSRHIDAVARFIHLAVPVRDVHRIVNDQTMRRSLDGFDKTVVADMLTPWLLRSAKQIVQTPTTGWGGRSFDWMARFFRGTASMNAMLLNVTNTMQQITGFSIAALKVRPRYLGSAMVRFMRSPRELTQWMSDLSPFMEARITTSVTDLTNQIEDIVSDQTQLEKVRAVANKHGYFMQAAAQHFVDHIVWLGKFEEATAGGASQAEAIAEADAAVRLTQGSFAPEDISRAATGPAFARMFTMYFDYFNMQANLLASETQQMIHNGLGIKKNSGRALYAVVLGFTVPAFFGEIIARAMRDDLDDDDDDGYLDEYLELFFTSQIRTAAAMVPVVGQAVQLGVGQYTEARYDDRLNVTPVATIVESSVRGGATIVSYMQGEHFEERDIRDLLSLLSVTFRIPVAPLARPLQYMYGVEQGTRTPSGPVDFTRGLMSGR